MTEVPLDDTAFLERLANARMPFGKFAGRLLIDLPEAYVVWFSHQGYPKGELGEQLASLYVIKENGLEGLLRPLVRREDTRREDTRREDTRREDTRR